MLGTVHKRQVLCALNIFGCSPEQVVGIEVDVVAASMLTQCNAPQSTIASLLSATL